MNAKSSQARSRLVVMLIFNLILFFVMLEFAVWRGVERKLYLITLAAMFAVIPLVFCVPVMIGGNVWQRLVALMLAVYPAIIFLDAVSDMLKYLSNR